VEAVSALMGILLGQKDRAVVEQVGIRVVSVDQENLGNVLRPGRRSTCITTFRGVGDVRLNRAVRQFDPALQDAAREPREPLLREFDWMVDSVPECPVFRSARDRRLPTANLPRTMRSGRWGGSLQEITDGATAEAFCSRRASNRTRFSCAR